MMRIATKLPRSLTLRRCRRFTDLGFQPIPDPPVDPLVMKARHAYEHSCYLKIDWKITENDTVDAAVKPPLIMLI